MNLRKLGRAVALALSCVTPLFAVAPAAHAQNAASDYPNRPIKFIVPYLPGGLGDAFARAVSQGLSERLGQPVVIDNRPGASQAIGAEAVAKSAPDGYTLFMGTQSGLVLNTIARKKLPYDPVRDFAPISMLFTTPLFLVVHPTVKANSLQELIALAKAQPGKLTFASIGQGTSLHLAAEMFMQRAKLDIVHVPYKGSAQAITDVLSGQVNMMFEGAASSLPHVRNGKLRVIASTGTKRSTDPVANVPTVNEIMPGFEVMPWFGIVAPVGTPRPIIDKLHREIGEVLKSKALRDLAASTSTEITPSTPEELGVRVRNELQQFTKIMRDAGIQPE